MPNQSESIAALAAALAKFQGQVHGATKNATNPHLRNKYADLASIWEAIREALTAHGLSVVQLPAPGDNGTLRLHTRLLHESGEWLESEIQMPLGKQDPQGYGSALTYARRYGLAALLGIVQEDDDAEGAMKRSEPAKAASKKPQTFDGGSTPEQQKLIGELIAKLGWTSEGAVGWLKKHYGVNKRAELTADQAEQAIADLEARVAVAGATPAGVA
jgi:hypothetical protein